MPTYEYNCETCKDQQERWCKVSERLDQTCDACGVTLVRALRTAPKPNWLALARGDSASPEAIGKFDKMHKQKAEQENRQEAEHGNYRGMYKPDGTDHG